MCDMFPRNTTELWSEQVIAMLPCAHRGVPRWWLKRPSRKETITPELIVILVRQELLGTGYANTHFAKFVPPIWVYSEHFLY